MHLTATSKLFACGILSMSAIVSAPLESIAAPIPEKPNIVFIISDDQRWDGLGVAGNPNVMTPHLDRMAKKGQWYREATIQVPTCSASRSAILTGLPPAQNGWYSNDNQRADILEPHGFDQYTLLPKELAKVGYHTAFAGKWHLIPEPWLCGFETVKRWMLAGAGAYRNPTLAEGNSRDRKVVKGYTQTIFADDAISVLKNKADGGTTQPLFLWLAFTAPHSKFQPNPPPFDGMYDDKTAKELAPPTFYDDPDKTRNSTETWRHYYEAISALDSEVGRIMDTVRNSSLSSNTVVVFLGDNGYMMGSRGLTGKYVPYEDSIRVPLIMWGPDSIMGARGTTVTASVNSLDLSPTFIKLAGGTPHAEWVGRDVTPTIKDGQPHDITWAVSSYPDYQTKRHKAYRTIRTPEHKLILWHPSASLTPELYDLKKDPAENTNLYGKPEAAEVQKKLETQLTEYRQKAHDNSWDLKGPIKSMRAMDRSEDAATSPTPKKARKKAKRADRNPSAVQQQ